MATTVLKDIGREKINEICEKHKLNEFGREMLEFVLELIDNDDCKGEEIPEIISKEDMGDEDTCNSILDALHDLRELQHNKKMAEIEGIIKKYSYINPPNLKKKKDRPPQTGREKKKNANTFKRNN